MVGHGGDCTTFTERVKSETRGRVDFAAALYNPSQSGHGIFLEFIAPDHALYLVCVRQPGPSGLDPADGRVSGNRVDAQAIITEDMRFGAFDPS